MDRVFLATCVLEAHDSAAIGRITPLLPGPQWWTEPVHRSFLSDPETVELVVEGKHVVVPSQPQKRVALNAARVLDATIWDVSDLLIVGRAVLRLESGVDLQDIRQRVAAWRTTFDPLTGLWKRRPLEEYARLRGRPGAVAVATNRNLRTHLSLQSLARSLSRRLGSQRVLAYLDANRFAVFAEGETSESLGADLYRMTSDGLRVTDWEGENFAHVDYVLEDVSDSRSFGASIDRCLSTLATT
jgi:hypothetical protein